MTKNIWKLAAALAVTVSMSVAQTSGVAGSQFQQAGQLQVSGGTQPIGNWVALTPGGRGPSQAVVGKPFSATEERKTVQTLGDGTQLENSDSNLFYRDSQGRTRVEQSVQGKTRIVITDPVAQTTMILDPATKTARRSANFVFAAQKGTSGGTRGGPMPQPAMRGGRGGTMTDSDAFAAGVAAARAGGARGGAVQDPGPTSEELGLETVNGVASQGTRNTQVIPAGRIGNNRDIHVVNERWYSIDLQLLVKTVNSDPRFGVTTYQLTNIVQGQQDPALFQIPSDYTVVEPGQ